jgi:hypothetical protein
MALAIPLDKMVARNRAYKLQIMENMVRSRLEAGGPLTAQEIVDGVRLTHEEFLYLAQAAMPAMNRDAFE